MAIAPLPFIGDHEVEDLVWPRPTLTLVKGLERPKPINIAPIRELPVSRGIDVTERRRIRAAKRTKKRRIAAIVAGSAVAVLLALPLSSIGTVTLSGQSTPGGAPSGLADGSIYVVHEGDTLASIAHRINPALEGALSAQMAKAIGSSTIVPGEQIQLP